MIKVLPLAICFVCLFLWGNLYGRTIFNLIQYESLLMTQLPAIIYFFFILGSRNGFKYIKRLFSQSSSSRDDETTDALISISLISGFIGSILSALFILSTLSEVQNIGHPISLMVFSSLYGVLLPLVLVFLRSRHSKQQSHKILAYTTIMPILICISVIFVLDFYSDVDSLNSVVQQED